MSLRSCFILQQQPGGQAEEVNKAEQTHTLHVLTHTAFYKISSPLRFHTAVQHLENCTFILGTRMCSGLQAILRPYWKIKTSFWGLFAQKKIIYKLKMHSYLPLQQVFIHI